MLKFENGHLVIRDEDNEKVFSTEWRLLTITDYVSGSITLPRVTISANWLDAPYLNRSVNHTLASVHPSATMVIGMFRIQYLEGQSEYFLGGPEFWQQAAGTHVTDMYATSHQTSLNPKPGRQEFQAALGLLTFQCSSGHLVMNERLIMRAYAPHVDGLTYTVYRPKQRIDYRLYCGLI